MAESRYIKREKYDALVAAFRDQPGNVLGASKAAKTTRDTARKAWLDGWPKLGWPAIRDVIGARQLAERATRARRAAERAERDAQSAMEDVEIEREKLLAEARLEAAQILAAAGEDGARRLEAAEREGRRKVAELFERANADGAEQASEEIMLCRASRKNALQAHGFIALVWSSARSLAEKIKRAIDTGEISTAQAMAFTRDLLRGTRDVAQASRLAIQTERLRVGDPSEVVALKLDPGSLEEAGKEIQTAVELYELAARRSRRQEAPAPPASGQNGSAGSGGNDGAVH